MINPEAILYAAWPLAAGIMMAILLAYIRQRRTHNRLTSTFILFVVAALLWSVGYGFELLAKTTPTRMAWIFVQYLGITTLSPLWLLFTLQFTGGQRWLKRRNVALLFLLPVVSITLVATDSFHHLHYQAITLTSERTPFPVLDFVYGPAFYVNWIYAYILQATAIITYFRYILSTRGIFRTQGLTLLAAMPPPWIGNALYVLNVVPIDLTVLGFAISAVIVAWSLFGMRLMDLVPAARDQVLDNMLDAVLVIDGQERIVDANQAAGRLANQPAAQLIGQPISIFSPVAEHLELGNRQRGTITMDIRGKQHYFDLNVSPLASQEQDVGRVLTISDMTDRQQVAEALIKNETRLRALFDSISDFIMVIDEQGYFTEFHVPAQWLDITPPEDFLGRGYQTALPHEAATRLQRAMQLLNATGLPQRFEFEQTMGGRAIWFSANLSLVQHELLGLRSYMVIARDITESKQAEAALRASESRYRSLFDTAFEAMMLSQTGEVLDVNVAFESLFRYNRSEVIGMPVVAFAADESRAVLANHILQEDEDDFQLELLRGDGAPFPAEIRSQTLIVGSRSFRVTAVRDLSERRRLAAIEERGRILAEVLRDTSAVLNSTLDLSAVLDRIMDNVGRVMHFDAMNIMLYEEGMVEIVRARGYESYGFKSTELALRVTALDMLNFQQMAKTGEPLAIGDIKLYPGWIPREHTNWVRSYAGAPVKVEGALVGFINLDSATPGFYQQADAERLQAFANQAGTAIQNARLYEATRIHNQQLELLNKITRIGTATLDLKELLETLADHAAGIIGGDDCYITLWDPAQKRVVDAVSSSAVREAYDHIPKISEPGEPSLTSSVLELGQALPVDDVLNSPYVPRRVAEQLPARSILAIPLRAGGRDLGALLLAFNKPHRFSLDEMIWADQTAELIALAVARAQSYLEVEQRNRELDAFGHTVAHDLKSPLHGVMSYIELVQNSFSSALPGDSGELLEEALTFTEKMDQIVESLLLLATTRTAETAMEPVDMRAVAVAAGERFKHQIGTRGIRLTISDDLPPAMGYGPWVEEVFSNLISNAIKYIGLENADPQIEIACRETDGSTRYEVTDNGIGLTAEQRARVFELLARFHESQASGSGLGLSIVERIVKRMNGEVGVESETDRGSTFWFTLPAASPDELQAEKGGRPGRKAAAR